MKNEQIIANVAVKAGLMTEEEVLEYAEAGREIGLHTYAGWAQRQRTVKRGEHGIETRLWKRKSGKNKDTDGQDIDSGNESIKQEFCLVKSYLFREDQTIPAGQEEV